jgi:carbon monoxide dehydrogenase subunit G
MKIHERFSVASDPGTVWSVISNPQTVVTCVPGASLGGQRDDGSWDASVAVKFGPVNVAFQALVTLVADEAAMIGRVTARGKDNQGGTRVASTMTFAVKGSAPAGSEVTIDSDVEISGRLAGVIETGAPIVVKRMAGEFAANLVRRCTAEAAGSDKLESGGEAG